MEDVSFYLFDVVKYICLFDLAILWIMKTEKFFILYMYKAFLDIANPF